MRPDPDPDALLLENAQLREQLAAAKLAASFPIQTFEGRTAAQWADYARWAEKNLDNVMAKLKAARELLA